MAEVEEEVRQEREQHGDDIDEEEVTKRMHAKFGSRGTVPLLCSPKYNAFCHEDIMVWKRFPYYLPFVKE